jgi:predicted MFS family arabinose efflux permease
MRRLREWLRTPAAALAGVARSRDLRRIQLAYVGSEVGSWIAMIAISVLSFTDGGLTGVGVVLGLRMLAPMLAAPFMGVLADRLPRKRVMIGADLVRVALVAAAAGVVALGWSVWIVYAVSSVVSIAGTAFRPAQAALLPSLARTPDELTASNTVSSTIESVTAFAGPALGGVLVAATNAETAFLVTAATFVWSAGLLLGIDDPRGDADETPDAAAAASGVLSELAVGARTLVADRRVGLLVGVLGAQVLVSGVFLVLINGIAFDVLDGDEQDLGVLLAGLGVGGTVGAVVALGLVGNRLALGLTLGVVLWGVPIALLAVWQSYAGVFILVALIGLANTPVDVAGFTLLQRAVPDDVLARVFGILESVLYAATVAGALLAPLLVAGLGLDGALVVTGLFLPGLVAVLWPTLRRLDVAAVPEDRLELVRGVPFLAPLPPTTLEHLAGALLPVTAAAGERIVTDGEDGDRFYILQEGRVSVVAGGRTVHEGEPGYYFGEIALLRTEPRMATVTATTDVRVLALERDEFIGAVTGHAESAAAADAVVASRLHASRPALLEL